MSRWTAMINDVRTRGRARARDVLVTGARGIGKTVLLNAFGAEAASYGYECIPMQAVKRSQGLITYLGQHVAREAQHRRVFHGALERLQSISFGIVGAQGAVTLRDPDPHGTTPMDLAQVLAQLSHDLNEEQGRGGLLITIDELQAASATELALLTATLDRLNSDHSKAPVLFAGSCLGQIRKLMGRAGLSHPERRYDIRELPTTFPIDEATRAIIEPARRNGVLWDGDAVDAVHRVSMGYPAHVQYFADAVWTVAVGPDTITLADAHRGIRLAEEALVANTHAPDWGGASDRQREYLAALAVLGGSASTAEIAAILNRDVSALAKTRDALIKQSYVHSPVYGHIAFTAPTFSPYVLQMYEHSRKEAVSDLIPLDQMQHQIPAHRIEKVHQLVSS